jgi:nicotinic acid phosphoribosyltransferase
MKLIPTLLCDFYKVSHREQYPENTEMVYSTWIPRSGKHLPHVDKVVCYGIQGFILEFFQVMQSFFLRPKTDVINEYSRYLKYCLGVPEPYTKHLEELHDLGYIPLKFKALPEGTLVPFRVPMMTVENTDPRFFWLTNYIETLASALLWKPCTTASIAYIYRKLLNKNAIETTGSTAGVEFQGHDFSMRGMSGPEDAARSGAGHLLSFVGTDTIPAIQYVEEYYGGDIEQELIGCSVPATEHSVMCAGGAHTEYETFKRLINDVYPTGIVSIVSDTWDLWDVITEILPRLKDEILKRGEGKEGIHKTVIRPDCYDAETKVMTQLGWKYFKDLDKDTDLVAEVLDDGTYHFVKPLKYVDEYYEGDMYYFHDGKGKLDLLVTPNHRMIFSKQGKEIVQTAEEAKVGYWPKDMLRSAKAKDKDQKLSGLDRLKIAFQADGSFQTAMTGRIRFSFLKQRKMDRLERILDECGFEYTKYPLSDGSYEYNVKERLDFTKDFSWVNTKDLCSNWCIDFIEELSYWDATRRHEDRIKFDTTTEEVMDVVELVALSAGYGVLITKTKDDRKPHFSDVYTAHILKSNLLGGQSQVKEKVQYSGRIYCVQVPSGKLLVKRNRSVIICGNSGDPVDILCGDTNATPNSPPHKGVVELLWELFGGTVTEQGYKVLDPHIGTIYGDAITLDRCNHICERLKAKGFATTNVVFGIGSYTYQYLTRDSLGFAMKSTSVIIDGVEKPIYKDPVTDDGIKKSARGRVYVVEVDGVLKCSDLDNPIEGEDLLEDIFCDGHMLKVEKFSAIRVRLAGAV